jgi:hypothetical protein
MAKRTTEGANAGGRAIRRRGRHEARRMLWALSSLKRVKVCGRRLAANASAISVVMNGDVAHYSGLQTCGSIHACPVCSPKIRQSRAEEIESALALHFAAGGGALFLTLTMPHDQGDRLAALLRVVAGGFSDILAGRRWQSRRQVYGILGTIRALEVNVGAAGWHPHLHVLILTEGPTPDVYVKRLEADLGEQWADYVERQGYRRPLAGVGWHLRPVRSAEDVAGYTAKVYDDAAEAAFAVGMELTRHDLKAGRRSGRNPFALLADVLATGDVDDLALWHEYETATKGRQVLTWSKGLKARFHVGEVTDDDLAAEEVGGDVVMEVPPAAFSRLCLVPGGTAGLLEAVEADGADAGFAYLRRVLVAAVGPPG